MDEGEVMSVENGRNNHNPNAQYTDVLHIDSNNSSTYSEFVSELLEEAILDADAAKLRLRVLSDPNTLDEMERFLQITLQNVDEDLQPHEKLQYLTNSSQQFLLSKIDELIKSSS